MMYYLIYTYNSILTKLFLKNLKKYKSLTFLLATVDLNTITIVKNFSSAIKLYRIFKFYQLLAKNEAEEASIKTT